MLAEELGCDCTTEFEHKF